MIDGIITGQPAELAGRRWSFGTAVLDERSLELTVGGEVVRLERKPLEVLLYLLHHAGEVVTKDDLAESLWPGRILTETVLTRCISLLRQALKDDDRSLIRTVHGFGYRLVADVKVEATGFSKPAALDFRPGDHPPLRPQWKLVDRLGTGGHGEAWLARHEKTGDARVFKFARDASALTSLKREITLYRLLHDTLGSRAAIARILEWNLAEPPYFIEMEYVAGGNLLIWSEAQGGLAQVPLDQRLEIVAQIAEALAAAHSVGALHKDLKPGNVLMHVENGKPTVRLCDFGSGGVIDPKRLEELGITRLGFTKTLADSAAGTPLYLAPEVVAGQPFTIQADVYSLGILLYQVIAGDLRRPLAPGWEADVEDELLREDISLAAAGNPARRLTDALQLAERLRALETRRALRVAEMAAQHKAERTRLALQELRRTKTYAAALFALTVVAAGGGITAHQARNEAVEATAKAEAVSNFLIEDVLRVERTVDRPQADVYKASLDRAAAQINTRFSDRPDAAASIHWLLGQRYEELGQVKSAISQYGAATAIYSGLQWSETAEALQAKERLAFLYIDHGDREGGRLLIRELQQHWHRAERTDFTTLMWRARIAKLHLLAGDHQEAETDLREILDLINKTNAPAAADEVLFKLWIGAPPSTDAMHEALLAHVNEQLSAILGEIGDQYEEGELRARKALEIYVRLFGDDSELAAFARLRLAPILISRGKYEEAQATLLRARTFYDSWLPAKHSIHASVRYWLGRMHLEQRHSSKAATLFRESDDLCGTPCAARRRYAYLQGLGEALFQMGRPKEAIEHLRAALNVIEPTRELPRYLIQYAANIELADVLRETGQIDEARLMLGTIRAEQADQFPAHAMRANYLRVAGLLALAGGDELGGIAALKESGAILEGLLGPDHWRTQRVRMDLAKARRALR